MVYSLFFNKYSLKKPVQEEKTEVTFVFELYEQQNILKLMLKIWLCPFKLILKCHFSYW